MVRLEFIKGIGGVVNIINGNIRDLDRNSLTAIEDVTRVLIGVPNFNAVAFHDELKAMQISGYIIIFDEIASMKPYLDQIDLFDGEIFNPSVQGVRYPSWDVGQSNKHNGIVPHSYTLTDIEKEMIQK